MRPYGRASVTQISPRAVALAAEAGYPVRLRILLALEEREQSTAELAELLGVTFFSAVNAVNKLLRADLVVVVRTEQAAEHASTMRRVYANRHKGWVKVRDAFEEVAGTA
jgi:DNA-binding MarR family transcriptional regulator